MSRVSLFNSPLLLGFEHFERALDRVNKGAADGYPPYNIEQTGDNSLRITLAVAGFTMADLTITIEDNQLMIRGKQTDDAQRVYLHRGIAARQFQRSFVLAEGIEVRGAWLDNGLLHIDLVRPPVEARVRTVPIRGPETGRPGERGRGARASRRAEPVSGKDGEMGPDTVIEIAEIRQTAGDRAGSALSHGVRQRVRQRGGPRRACRRARTRRRYRRAASTPSSCRARRSPRRAPRTGGPGCIASAPRRCTGRSAGSMTG